MNAPRILLALASLAMLQGCIAAALAPLAAGGMIVRSAVTGERSRQALVEGTTLDIEALGDDIFAEIADLQVRTDARIARPIPQTGPLARLYSYTLAGIERLGDVPSALLKNPERLRPERAECTADLPAVLIDLDPEGGLAALEGPLPDTAPLAAVLGDLRGRGVAIAWMTDRTPEEAGALRARLAESGLDEAGRDPLFVQRFPGERKQPRRRALGETHCVLAMLGDERRDFDDLYDFVRDPAVALPLEVMVDDGWFITLDPPM